MTTFDPLLFSPPAVFVLGLDAAGRLYVVSWDVLTAEPTIVRAWMPTDYTAAQVALTVGMSADALPATPLEQVAPYRYRVRAAGSPLHRREFGTRDAAVVERLPLPQPDQRGRPLELRFVNGWWVRERPDGRITRDGLVEQLPPLGLCPQPRRVALAQ